MADEPEPEGPSDDGSEEDDESAEEASGEPTDDAADDGFLTLAEIYQLDLRRCELAILSACETNFGPQQQGEGVWAISRGFLVAGSRRQVGDAAPAWEHIPGAALLASSGRLQLTGLPSALPDNVTMPLPFGSKRNIL